MNVAPGAAARRLCEHLRSNGIRDEAVLSAMARVPRHAFVPAGLAERAYADEALPIEARQTISQPFVVATMTELLEVRYWHKVLEVGTGSGYQTAILSQLCHQVCTIERYQQLHLSAVERFARLGLPNIRARWGDGFAGWPEEAPFDRIIVTAAARELPARLAGQLAVDGVLVAPIGRSEHEQAIWRYRRTADGLTGERLLAVRFVPMLAGAEP